MSKIKITFAAAGEAVEAVKTPVIICEEKVHVFGDLYWTAEQYFEFSKAIPLTLSTETEGADIYYTIDGSEPTLDNPKAKLYTPGEAMGVEFFTDEESGTDNGATSGTIKVAAYKDGYLASEVAERTFTRDFDWWERLNNGEYEVDLRMLHFTTDNALSMGHLTLSGAGKVVVDGNDRWLDIQFQPMDLGGLPAYLRNMWYFDSKEDGQSDDYQKKWKEAAYKLGLQEGTEVEWARIKLYSKEALQAIALQSNFEPMGIQRAWMEIDYSELSGVEKAEEVDIPVVATVLASDKSYIDVTFSMPSASQYAETAEIYYMITTGETWDDTKKVKYEAGTTIKVTKDMVDTATNTTNVLVVAVDPETGKQSMVSLQKLSFDTEINAGTGGGSGSVGSGEVDVTEDGKYRVEIALHKASENVESMGDVAFDNNRSAIITTEDGKSVIRIGSNPVRIDPYYSALKEMQYKNAKGQWQYVTAVERDTITAEDGKDTHSLDYLSVFEFELPSTDEDYVPVKINVPYTPMDGITANVGGFIEARIYIDWDSLEETDDGDDIVADSSAAAGSASASGEAVDTKDDATGVKIEANEFVFEDDTEFTVTVITTGNKHTAAKNAIGANHAGMKLYEISAVCDGEETEPAGQVVISIPVLDGVDASTVKLYRTVDADKPVDAYGTELEYTLSGDGKYYVLKVKELGLFAIGYGKVGEIVTPDAVVDVPAVPTVGGFSDITGHWAQRIILEAVEKGFMSGTSATTFAPNADTTRGMFVTALGRMEGVQNGMYAGTKFKDVTEKDYFYTYVAWAIANGVASGVNDTQFAPNENVTREQMASILYRYGLAKGFAFDGESKTFTDAASISTYAKDAVDAMVKAGIMNGRADGTFDPNARATRAEMATVLVNFANKYMK